MSQVDGRYRHDSIECGRTQPATHCEVWWKASVEFFDTNPPQQRYLRCSLFPAVDAGCFAIQTGPTLMKLTTICDVSHVISYTRPFSPFFFWGHREEGLGMSSLNAAIKVVLASMSKINSLPWCLLEG